ncbi:TIGR03619 family F420-dependent LLM class oxidoreductase [Cryptosporangium aurantiacum]|uniref:Probable F420-dependent oxidoreductase, Rv2161c family n=1 Tax=Cryptosporangium aurantiacum TaxID=134849 RepID=A0A1M7K7J2_9ACTN|nr:TIGR03619 family F420-dependent LLM class oxidoreductase [Cryptosporangium aurantiacum]SHM61250.1 probable F420-dependent oxidoreductase, Rv2161c family [Cryptosporangium aurantiacum]
MRLGLFGINTDLCALDPRVAADVAVAAEDAGWESVWTGEHYVLPDPAVPASPTRPDTPFLDPFVALGHLAGVTRTLLLGTGVTVVPVHPPVLLAKQVVTVDRISGGRFLFGIGVGYLEPEFRALGVPLSDRGVRTDEYLEALHALWTTSSVHVIGPRVSISGVTAEPRPIRPGGPPLHVGGASPAALRRTVSRAHGWYGWAVTPEQTAAVVTQLAELADNLDRPAELGRLEISVTPAGRDPLDTTLVAAYADAGVDRLIVSPPGRVRRDREALLRFVRDTPAALLG